MISMGGYYGCITIAKYDSNYVKFLKGDKVPQSFLTMDEYGPFDLRRFEGFKLFFENIAILIRSSEDGRM